MNRASVRWPRRLRAHAALAVLAAMSHAHALTLAQAEALARQRNPDLAIAAAQVVAAHAGVLSAGQIPNPTLNVGATNLDPWRGLGPGPVYRKSIDATAGISWTYERGGKRELRVDNARAQVRAAEWDLMEARRQQLLAVRQAYFDVKQAQERVELLGEAEGIAQQTLDTADRRVRAGDLPPLDLQRLRVELAHAQNDRRAAQGELGVAQQTLALLIGSPGPGERIFAEDAWPAAVEPPKIYTEDEVARRPDIAAARAREDAALAARELARTQRVRDVTIGVQFERFPPESRGSIGVSASIPIFWNYRFEGEIARAEAEILSARLTREKLAAQARSEAERARIQVVAALDRLSRLNETGLPAGERAASGVQFAYSRGAASLTDLLDARRQLQALRTEIVQARNEYARALAAWRAATEWENP